MQTRKNKNKSNKSIDNKKQKSNSIIKSELNNRTKKLYYINNIQKEIISKNNEEGNIMNKKLNHIKKQKSIDNTLYKNRINDISSSNNSYQHVKRKKNILNKKIINTKNINANNNNQSNINALRKINKISNSKRHPNIKIDNIKNNNNKIPLNNYSNIYFPLYQNEQNEKGTPNEMFIESNETSYNNDTMKYHNKNVLTTFIQIEELTKIPDRIGGRKNKYAEYDYNEAKRAAVTCRRIEYSYNLRNVIKSEICLDEVIMIQRWWRYILRRRNEEILKELEIFEKLNSDNIQRYILFLNKIHYIYILHLLKKFIKKLKANFGKLYYKNYFNRNASKIQKAFRESLSKRKTQSQNDLAILLRKYLYKYQKSDLLKEIDNIFQIINKLKYLQNFIKFYYLRRNEKYYLKTAHEIHPFLYYYYKYRVINKHKSIRKIKQKIYRFTYFLNKWKDFVKYQKFVKSMMFLENLKFILKKKFFIFFILRLVERINAMITYFLLQPLMKHILRIYYIKKIKKAFSSWKNKDKNLKRKNKLAINLITKTVRIYTIDFLIKQLKDEKK